MEKFETGVQSDKLASLVEKVLAENCSDYSVSLF